MKLILSRKGFDSASGGGPSPIFPDGTMFSLPIPSGRDEITYGELRHYSETLGEVNIGGVVQDLTIGRRKRYGPTSRCHLDPDINFHVYPRQEGWKGLFGQAGGTETHLADEGVDAGDLFLFFGLFREVEEVSGHWDFVPRTTPKHILWGWLQVGKLYEEIGRQGHAGLEWANHHPHMQYRGEKNTLYVASERLDFGDDSPGWGVFPKLNERLVLTLSGHPKSHWKLPRGFYPDGDKQPLSHHRDRSRVLKATYLSPDPWEPRWKPNNDDYAYLESVGRGQEFVLNLDKYDDVKDWARGLIRDLGAR